MSEQKQIDKDAVYYDVLAFLEDKVKQKEIDKEKVKIFKEKIRDNKYVSTYIRALKEKIKDINNIDDFIRLSDKEKQDKTWPHEYVDYEIKNIMDAIFGSNYEVDPIKVIHHLINYAMEREGKICDFRDSVNPDKIMGRCQYENHYENAEDDVELTEEEQVRFDEINEKEGWMEACFAFEDKFNPIQELTLTLYSDEDTHKFDDGSTEYVCAKCMEELQENNDCEVSCDME